MEAVPLGRQRDQSVVQIARPNVAPHPLSEASALEHTGQHVAGSIRSMRIALQNSLPNHPYSAEAEWIRGFFTACERLGFEPVEVITSHDILRCQPDCGLVTHEFLPKLTPFPTLGLNWSPPAFFAGDPVRRRAILSLDGHLCGSVQSQACSTLWSFHENPIGLEQLTRPGILKLRAERNAPITELCQCVA